MFNIGKFDSSAGGTLDWKIECDDLKREDWEWAAHVYSQEMKFCIVHCVPNGGLPFQEALHPYSILSEETVVICDDVLTTGESMEKKRKYLVEKLGVPKINILGVVLFSRMRYQRVPMWIDPIFQLYADFIPRRLMDKP